MIKLIGIDVDGTLLDRQGQLPHENVIAVAEAIDRGIHVVLVTGRSHPSARPVADALPRRVRLIVSSGAVERAPDGTTVSRRLLHPAVAGRVLTRTQNDRAHAALIFDRDGPGQIVTETMDWDHPGRRAYFERNQHLIARAAPLEAALTEPPIQVMFNGRVAEMRRLAAGLTEGVDYAVSVAEYEHRDFALVDVTAVEATKGQALARCAAALGLDRTETMAIGDNLNDLDMLEYAGVPVVMGNAVETLRRRGWAVTADQDHHGVAQAIRRWAL